MIKVHRVWLNRVEGQKGQLGQTTARSLDEANRILKTAAITAPKDGGHHKVDFKVTWEDGEKYEGRYDLTYADTWKPDLGNTIRRFMNFYGGLERPPHMTDEQYEAVVAANEQRADVSRQDYIDFLKGRQTF